MLINDRELAVEVDGGGPPVVFLHGLGGTSNVFQIQADIVAAHNQVIRIDFAGAGRSPLAGPVSIESHTADVVAVLDALGVPGPAVVVAHSMGTLVARALAARFPARVRGLAMLAPVPAPGESGRHFQQDDSYVLGRSASETRRLQAQENIFGPYTEQFLRMVGIGPGMQVLDVGSGAGDVALAAAALAGTRTSLISLIQLSLP
jgi:pimeloyl-ACP methyl ester carboxylesterase